MKPKNVSTGAGQSEPRGLVELPLDDEHRDGAQDDAGQSGAPAQRRQPVIEHADIAEFVEPDRRRIGPGGALARRRSSSLPQAAICGIIANMIAGA